MVVAQRRQQRCVLARVTSVWRVSILLLLLLLLPVTLSILPSVVLCDSTLDHGGAVADACAEEIEATFCAVFVETTTEEEEGPTTRGNQQHDHDKHHTGAKQQQQQQHHHHHQHHRKQQRTRARAMQQEMDPRTVDCLMASYETLGDSCKIAMAGDVLHHQHHHHHQWDAAGAAIALVVIIMVVRAAIAFRKLKLYARGMRRIHLAIEENEQLKAFVEAAAGVPLPGQLPMYRQGLTLQGRGRLCKKVVFVVGAAAALVLVVGVFVPAGAPPHDNHHVSHSEDGGPRGSPHVATAAASVLAACIAIHACRALFQCFCNSGDSGDDIGDDVGTTQVVDGVVYRGVAVVQSPAEFTTGTPAASAPLTPTESVNL